MSSVLIARLRIEARARLLGSSIADVVYGWTVGEGYGAGDPRQTISYASIFFGFGYDEQRDIEYGLLTQDMDGDGNGCDASYFQS